MGRTPSIAASICAGLILCICAGASPTQSPAPTKQGKQVPAVPDWKPAILPADALAYGAALYQQAPPKLKAWCEEFANKEMPKRRIDPRETMAVVDKQFPQNSDEARDATIYLIFYLSYLAEDANQRQFAGRIRRMDDEAQDILLRMQSIRDQESNRMVSPRRIPGQQEMIRTDESIQRLEQQLFDLNDRRKQTLKELTTARKRVDGHLKVLDITHKRMNGIEPSILREFP